MEGRPDPKENSIQNTSVPNLFVGENAMSIYEFTEESYMSRSRVVELVEAMGDIRESLVIEFKREVNTTK
jgi:hypothetical protein